MGKRIIAELSDEKTRPGTCLWRIRNLELNERRMELSCEGRTVQMEPKPLAVLMLLLRNPDRVIPLADIRRQVWNGRTVSDSVIAQAISRLRRMLGPNYQSLVVTVPGWGYRLSEIPTLDHPPSDRKLVTLASAERRRRGPVTRSVVDGPKIRRGWREVETHGFEEFERSLIQHPAQAERRYLLTLRCDAAVERARREQAHRRNYPAALLKLPELVHAHCISVAQGTHCGSAEYPEGPESLATYLDRHGGFPALDASERLQLARQLISAVVRLHEKGLFLGGLSPASLLVQRRERGPLRMRVFLPAADRHSACLAPRLYATTWQGDEALYRAPEAHPAEPAQAAEDIYALGILTAQLLLGCWRSLPLSGWHQEVRDESLLRCIERATLRHPHHRYSRLAQFLNELDEHAALQRWSSLCEQPSLADQAGFAGDLDGKNLPAYLAGLRLDVA